jgi:radical SAM protein with 4Fe4S-binding SPASM domain
MKTYITYINQFEKSLRGDLYNIDIELTERCNNNCVHCYINLPIDDTRAKQEEMSFEQITDILRQAAELGCIRVRYTGGEPLLRPEFEMIYEYTRRLGMRVLLFTNARLITPRLAQLFSHIPPLEKIEVSVYGLHADSYDANTLQPGAFKSFWQGVNLLLEYKIPFVVKSVILPANRNELDEFEIWAKTIPWMDKKLAYTIIYDLRTRRDNPQKNQLINSLRLSPEEVVKFESNFYEDFERIKDYYWKIMTRLPGNRLFGCNAGEKQLCIDAYGRIQACMGLRSPELVLPSGTSLKDALKYFKGLKEIKTTNPEYLERCGQCFLRNLCEQCPAKAWAETGTLDTPVQYLCDVTIRKINIISSVRGIGELLRFYKQIKLRYLFQKFYMIY